MNLAHHFPTFRFSPPADEATIAAAEAALGITLPEPLAAVYRECDGLREDRDNAKYLLSLLEDDYIGTLQAEGVHRAMRMPVT